MKFKLLVVKETRANEKRVGLIPQDAKVLINQGHEVYIEHNAGKEAGFDDQEYENAGASIRFLEDETLEAYQKLFKDIQLIIRAKRPMRAREVLESKAMLPGTIMIGGLDPLEKHSSHVHEYHEAKISAYSIDQLTLPPDDPMNILAAMSKIAGKLALLDAIQKCRLNVKKIVIIGFGVVGQSAYHEALKKTDVETFVILSNALQSNEIKEQGATPLLLDKDLSIELQQSFIKKNIVDADIVITSARRANQSAPVLIPNATLDAMKKGSVIVDMALSEGGNVEGSEHDATLVMGNEVIVTNVSGYPKAVPHEASQLWSQASLHFVLMLADEKNIKLAKL